MPKIITCIRHAEPISLDLDAPILEYPAPLDTQYDLVLTSPYLRCRQTVDGININNKPVYVDVRLSEYQGHKIDKNEAFDSTSLEYGPIPLYDETWNQCKARVDEHWKYLKTIEGNVLVVTHGIIVNYIYEIITGKKLEKQGRFIPYGNGFSTSIN